MKLVNVLLSLSIIYLVFLNLACSVRQETVKFNSIENWLQWGTFSTKLVPDQVGFLWKLDSVGCLGFRLCFHNSIDTLIVGMSEDSLIKFLGTPNKIEQQADSTYYYDYYLGGEYCNTPVLRSEIPMKVLGMSIIVIKDGIVVKSLFMTSGG